MSHAFTHVNNIKDSSGARSRSAASYVSRRQPVANAPAPTGCACGGGCPRCTDSPVLQQKPIEGVIQRDFEEVPQRSEEEIAAALAGGTADSSPQSEDQPPPDTGDMGGMQMKLIVGSQDDPSEREADQAADAIVAGLPAPTISPNAGNGVISRAPVQDSGVKPVPGLSNYLADPGAGSLLPHSMRAQVEAGLGAEFGHVRLHTDTRAQAAAASVGARAFTLGSNIWLGKNESASDTRLMAHELIHVVQQGHAAQGQAPGPQGQGQIQRKIITSPAKLVSFIEGAEDKTETRTDPVTGTTGPAHAHLLEHQHWHSVDHRDPGDAEGKDIDGSFGTAFMEFHHTMMEGFKAAGGSVTTGNATTAPISGVNWDNITDPAKLAKINTTNNFGNLMLRPHNRSHQLFAKADAEDVGMNSFYWAPRHDVFYKLHMWMDERYMDFKKSKAAKPKP